MLPSRRVDADFSGTARFEIVRRLGVGGMGVVYEAFDRELQTRVALKTLRTWTADAFLRFKTEFRSLQDIQHPNLVSLGELFEDRGTWFFTMELVRGETFLRWVCAPTADAEPELDDGSTVALALAKAARAAGRKTTGGPVADERRLRIALGQLASGLHALHRAQKVHRDIKPANVLVTPEGRVKILDFGLVIDPTHAQWPDAQPVGTASYMAPEQCQLLSVGPEADWYAVGVVLYQALTGQVPFSGSQVIERKQVEEPAPPSKLRPSVPRDLDQLCTELLRLAPAARPSGREVLRRLRVDDAAELTPVTAETFIGRGRELDVLSDAFFASLRSTVVLLVHGESGVGKTTLVERFVERVRSAFGAAVFAGRCDERESVPYKAVDGVIDTICRRLGVLPADELAERLPPDVGLLGLVFPVMKRLEAVAEAPRPEAVELDPHDLRRRVFATLRELLVRLARREPLVLVIDDLQWADADSLALLDEVLAGPDAPRLCLIATMRDIEGGEVGSHKVKELAALLPGDVRQLAVESLPPEDARALVDLLAGEAGKLSPASHAIDREAIAREAAGHPMFIHELIRGRELGGARPVRLEDALWARIARLDDEARDVLEVIAVGGAPVTQETAARALATEIGPFAQQVARLRAAHLVKTSGSRRTDWIEPYHDRVRNAVLANLEPGERGRWHQRLAVALEASSQTQAEALATHWRGAGDPGKAAIYAARAAEDAATALAFDRAARLYRLAVELRGEVGPDATPADRAEALRLSTRLGDALTNAGRGVEAAAAYLAAAAVASPVDALDLRRRAADQLLRSGHIDDGLEVIRSVLNSVDLELPRSPRAALVRLVTRRAQVRLRGLGFTARAEADVPADALRRIDVCWSVAAGLGLVDNARGSYFQTRGLLYALAAGEPSRIARALAAEAAFAATGGSHSAERSEKLLAAAERIAREVEDPYVLAWAAGAQGLVAALEGRWETALDRCSAGIAIFERHCVGVAWELAIMSWFSLMSLAYLGRIEELGRRVARQLVEAEGHGDLHAEIGCSTGVNNLAWLAADDPDQAARRGEHALSRWSHTTFHNQHWWNALGQTQILLYRGDGPAALRRITAAWPGLRSSLLLTVQLTRIEATHLRGRAALLSALGEKDGARKKLLAAAARDAHTVAAEKNRWSTPLARLLEAGIAAARGDATRAAALLAEAIPGLDAAGLALYAAAARARAARLADDSAGTAAALAWFAEHGVVRPARMLQMLAPGFPE